MTAARRGRGGVVDLVLSSGYLAFAAHAGFLAAVEDLGIRVDGLCGTSSGALVGALWAGGLGSVEILDAVCAGPPLLRVRPHPRPWEGLLSLSPLAGFLADRLPPRLEDFPLPVGVGTRDPAGLHRLVTAGPSAPAVLASCAVPWLFAPVALADGLHADGGAVDRTGLGAWRRHRPGARVALHLVERSAGREVDGDPAELMVRSPRSGAHLWSLGDVRVRFADTRARARAALAGLPAAR